MPDTLANATITMEWLMEDAIDASAGLSLARMTVPPGTLSQLHTHPNCSETIHVLTGQIEQRTGNTWQALQAGDTVVVPRDTLHQTRNIGAEPAVLMIAYSSGTRIYHTP